MIDSVLSANRDIVWMWKSKLGHVSSAQIYIYLALLLLFDAAKIVATRLRRNRVGIEPFTC